MRVVMATKNRGKAAELGRMLASLLQVEPLDPSVSLPKETGLTFEENARLKARAAFASLGSSVAVLADDSGLEVDALGGEPGVYSARYAGEGAGDEANYRKLLAALDGLADRSARFVCHLILLLPRAEDAEPREVHALGYLEGDIASEARGDSGFGYDPVFRPRGWDLTLAEVGPAEKDRVSHRGAAAAALLAELSAREILPPGVSKGEAR
jgi:XTP/dITP diphosphohydrolase